MSNFSQIVCPHCWVTNRVPSHRLCDGPVCGKCKLPLFYASPVDLSQANFRLFIDFNNIPILVNFWAPGSHASLEMAAACCEAASVLEPQIRLCNVNTDSEPLIAEIFRVKKIPSLCLLSAGKEHKREFSTMDTADIIKWVNEATCAA